jgi:hypothetical protein
MLEFGLEVVPLEDILLYEGVDDGGKKVLLGQPKEPNGDETLSYTSPIRSFIGENYDNLLAFTDPSFHNLGLLFAYQVPTGDDVHYGLRKISIDSTHIVVPIRGTDTWIVYHIGGNCARLLGKIGGEEEPPPEAEDSCSCLIEDSCTCSPDGTGCPCGFDQGHCSACHCSACNPVLPPEMPSPVPLPEDPKADFEDFQNQWGVSAQEDLDGITQQQWHELSRNPLWSDTRNSLVSKLESAGLSSYMDELNDFLGDSTLQNFLKVGANNQIMYANEWETWLTYIFDYDNMLFDIVNRAIMDNVLIEEAGVAFLQAYNGYFYGSGEKSIYGIQKAKLLEMGYDGFDDQRFLVADQNSVKFLVVQGTSSDRSTVFSAICNVLSMKSAEDVESFKSTYSSLFSSES